MDKTTLTIDLPWPPKDLSPNARVHWAKKSRAAKSYRQICRLITQSTVTKSGFDAESIRADGDLSFQVTYYLPDRRRRDDDNLIASFKAGRDGISDALRIDDSRFKSGPPVMHDTPVKGGLVRVRIG